MDAGHESVGARGLGPARRWIVLAALTVVALVLGIVGFERLPEGPRWSFGDSLMRSIQLFVFESNAPAPPIPWQLEIARFLAPAITAYAAVLAGLALFRDELRRLAIRLRARDHTIVAGLGGKGFRLASRFHRNGAHVVAIERDPAAPAIASCRERGIAVIVGDATDPRILAGAALARGRNLFVVCGDDGANADVAFAAQRAVGHAADAPAAFVHLDDLDLWRHLKGHQMASGEQPAVRTEFFNVADAGARLLLEHHPPFEPGEPAAHVVVCGTDGIGESVVLHVARRWLSDRGGPADLLRLTVTGPDAEANRARLLTDHPRLGEICDIHAGDPDPDGPSPTAAYVCTTPEARAASQALSLSASGALGGATAVVAVRDENEGIATTLSGAKGVVAFGYVDRALGSDLVRQSTTEVLARAKHDQYVRDELERGRTPAENPSMVPWHELDESLRQSNRRFAQAVGEKLRSAGIAVLPAPLADPSNPGEPLPEAQVEELAVDEHDRWCADLRADGWTRTDGPKDPERRRHPSLVPWEELSEDERDKDREPIRALPEMLAHAGFELRPTRGTLASGRPASPLTPA